MLIHLTPKFYTCSRSGPNVSLLDLNIAELGISLNGDKELTTRSPYPNKRLYVACKKEGKKAINGIFIETANFVPKFTAVYRWAIDAEYVVTHSIEYVVLDNEFDAVTDNMVFWYAHSKELGGWGQDGQKSIKIHRLNHNLLCNFQMSMKDQELLTIAFLMA